MTLKSACASAGVRRTCPQGILEEEFDYHGREYAQVRIDARSRFWPGMTLDAIVEQCLREYKEANGG